MKAGPVLFEETRRAYGLLPATLGQSAAGPPCPGDLLTLEATAGQGVEWAILARDDTQTTCLLAVPADAQPLVGRGDVAISESAPAGPLVLRCSFGGWYRPELFAAATNTGALAPADVERGLEQWTALENQATASILEQEAADDLEYQSWVRQALEPAQRALAEQNLAFEEEGVGDSRPHRSGRFLSWRLLALAAALFAALAMGLIWRQRQTLRELRELNKLANHQHLQEVGRLTAEYDEKVESLATLRHQQDELIRAAERRIAQHEGALERLRSEISRLGQQLAAARIKDLQLVPLDPPSVRLRGEVTELSLGAASHLILVIAIKDPLPGRKYRTELVQEPSGKRLWISEELRESDRELLVLSPASVFPAGDSTLRCFALGPDDHQLLNEYPIRIARE